MIIYWVNNKIVYPLLNKDGGLYLFDTLKEADEVADNVENNSYKIDTDKIKFVSENAEPTINDEVESRVISIERVKE